MLLELHYDPYMALLERAYPGEFVGCTTWNPDYIRHTHARTAVPYPCQSL